ncbi:hypothetical protein MLD38_033827 [Melastoma candidum]|uniref:Uncharacterized protein n=1 Tax=Melastoma candidum TaxID=119954 RepID=A0ACB9M8K4_9MYRT|nr:hypothetical protein MLD38_033827 [Melastoma candidum]
MDNDDDTEFSCKDWGLRARSAARGDSPRHTSEPFERRPGPLGRISSSPAPRPPLAILPEMRLTHRRIRSPMHSKSCRRRQGFVNIWDSMSPEGFELHSKWSNAERYICNPLSGEVPMECLLAKTVGQRSFQSMTSREEVRGED